MARGWAVRQVRESAPCFCIDGIGRFILGLSLQLGYAPLQFFNSVQHRDGSFNFRSDRFHLT
jgi:hypothetical protein